PSQTQASSGVSPGTLFPQESPPSSSPTLKNEEPINFILPACFFNARDLSFVCQLAEFNPAHAKFTHIAAGTSVNRIPVVQTGRRSISWQFGQSNVIAGCF